MALLGVNPDRYLEQGLLVAHRTVGSVDPLHGPGSRIYLQALS